MKVILSSFWTIGCFDEYSFWKNFQMMSMPNNRLSLLPGRIDQSSYLVVPGNYSEGAESVGWWTLLRLCCNFVCCRILGLASVNIGWYLQGIFYTAYVKIFSFSIYIAGFCCSCWASDRTHSILYNNYKYWPWGRILENCCVITPQW